MTSIKEQIGKRILEQRVAKGLSAKALEELTGDIKQSRIYNWERGERTPGPEEIKQLARALDVSPAYLMCLSDEKHPAKIPGLGRLLPLLNHQQACEPFSAIEAIKNRQNFEEEHFIPISIKQSTHIGKNAFALHMKDDSMHPELKMNDVLIIDPDYTLHPGNLVAALTNDLNEAIIRRYKQLDRSKDFQPYELRAENAHWGNVKISQKADGRIVGVVVSLIRDLEK